MAVTSSIAPPRRPVQGHAPGTAAGALGMGRNEGAGPAFNPREQRTELPMPLILWLLGVPGVIVILLWVFGVIGF